MPSSHSQRSARSRTRCAGRSANTSNSPVETIIHRLPADRFEELRELTRSAAKRRKAGQYLVEGPHLVESALDAKASIEEVLITEEARSRYSELLEKAAHAGI